MKKSLIIFAFVLVGCTTKFEEPTNIENSRIKIVEHIAVNGVSYKIIKVDSSEYLLISNGGLVKHSK